MAYLLAWEIGVAYCPITYDHPWELLTETDD